MKQTPIRVGKILKELNVSLDRVLEFLEKENQSTEISPNSKIPCEVYESLLVHFKDDKSKLQHSDKVAEEKEKEKEEILNEIEKSEEVIRAKTATISGIKVHGKIDLDKYKKKKVKPKKEVTPPPEKEVIRAKDGGVVRAEEDNITTSEKEKLPLSEKEPEVKSDESKKEEEKEIEVIRGKASKIEGPKVTGEVVDLKKFEKKPSQKKTDQEKSNTSESHRRRKRIRTPQGGVQRSNDKKRHDRRKSAPKVELTDEEIQKQVRETLEKLQGKSKFKGVKYRKEKREDHKEKEKDSLEQQRRESKILRVTEFVTVSEMASLMEGVPISDIISACMSLGIMVTMNQRLDAETLSIVAGEFGYEIQFTTDDLEEIVQEDDNPEDLKPRAPVVTVMGHVDHGKTSLLDYIREENVIAGESGGITQHIGAYSVVLKDGRHITFFDTPGHEAFTAMRARGTQVTDIVVIVIAADDGIMPQTKEAISHAQAAGVPIIFAINKVDRPAANPEKIKEELSGMNLLVEDWGGKIQSHDISAKTGQGVSELLEKILLEAEMLDLKANPDKNASGTVVEAFLDKGRGYVATVLIQAGTLKMGDYVLAEKNSGKVKAMHDERGNPVREAGPSSPISILGLDGAPQAGDRFYVFDDDREAKQMADRRLQLYREQTIRTQKHITLDEVGRRIAIGDFKELNVIIKGDVDGSVEALTDSIQKLSSEEIQINIIHRAVGTVTESDVLLASASDAVIIGFNVRPIAAARTLAEKEGVDVRMYSIIYDAINDVKDAMEGLLSPEIKEEVTGSAEIRQVFKVSKIGSVAGCMVMDGKIYRDSKVRLIRDGIIVYTGVLASLKRFKDDVKEVSKGYDCGMQIKGYNEILENDVIEAFKEVEVRKKLKK